MSLRLLQQTARAAREIVRRLAQTVPVLLVVQLLASAGVEVSRKDLADGAAVELTVTVPASAVEAAWQAAMKRARKGSNVPGFRKGAKVSREEREFFFLFSFFFFVEKEEREKKTAENERKKSH